MTPVQTYGIDSPVSQVGQSISTALTFGLALVVVVWLIVLWRRERIVWPFLVAASGIATCLMEPLFDHLYGLWFFVSGQWHLYTTFGSAQPIWVPPAYLTFYGGATIVVARLLARRPGMRTVWAAYAGIVVMAAVAEITYVSVLKVYAYQDRQPFVVLGYPLFLAFTNAMAAVVGGIIVFRLVPLLTGPARLWLLMVVPLAFAVDLFGSGILYLSVRHWEHRAPMIVVHLAALTVVAGIAATIRLLGLTLVEGRTEAVGLRPGRPAESLVASAPEPLAP